MDQLQRRFSPLLLINAPDGLHDELRKFVPELNSVKYSYTVGDDESEVRNLSHPARFMLLNDYILFYADTKHSRSSLMCKTAWSRFVVTDPAAFISKAHQLAVTEGNRLALEALGNDGLCTFDYPIAVIHVFEYGQREELQHLKERSGDLPVAGFIELELMIESEGGLNSNEWVSTVSKFFSAILYPFMAKTINEAQQKSSARSTQTTLGYASKFFSSSMKYLTQQKPLQSVKHSDQTVEIAESSTATIISSKTLGLDQFMLRRAGDLAFMLQNYRQAQGIYEGLRKEAQQLKSWNVAALAHFWTSLSKIMSGSSEFSANDLDGIVQQLLSSPEFQFTAVQSLSILSLLNIPADQLFPAYSRLTLAPIDPVWKLSIFAHQIFAAVALKKNRLALFLIERFASQAILLTLERLALASLLAANILTCSNLKLFFFSISKQILVLSKSLNVPLNPMIAELALQGSNSLTKEQVESCWSVLGSSQTERDRIIIIQLRIGRRDPAVPEFSLNDLHLFKILTDFLWNTFSISIDPLKLLLSSHETVLQTGKEVLIEFEMWNGYQFNVELEDILLVFAKDNGEEEEIASSPTVLLAGSSSKLTFSIRVQHDLMLKSVSLVKDANITLAIPFDTRGFRLNFTKAQKIVPTYADNYGYHVRTARDAEFASVDLFLSSSSANGRVTLNQECILELTVRTAIPKSVNVILFNDSLIPLDYEVHVIGNNRVLKDLRTDQDGILKVLLQTVIGKVGSLDYVVGVFSAANEFRPILKRVTIKSDPLLTLNNVKLHGMKALGSKMLSLSLINTGPETIKVYEAYLIFGSSKLPPLGPARFELRPTVSFTCSFSTLNLFDLNSRFILRLQDGRILNLTVAIPFPEGPIAEYQNLGNTDSTTGLTSTMVRCKVIEGEVFSIPDDSGSQTVCLGEVRKSKKKDRTDLVMDILVVSPNDGYAALPSPLDHAHTNIWTGF